MSTSLDEVIDTVRAAREDGPEALAAMALSYGATMALGAVGNRALRGQIAELRAAQTAADEMRDALRHERDAACAELKHALESVAALRAERDAAREALAAQDSAPDLDYPARAEVWRLREVVEAHRTRAEKAEAERDAAVQERDEARSIAAMRDRALTAAVQEREAFGLRLSAAERERDEAQAERDALRSRPTYEARTVAPTIAEWRGHFRAGGSWIVLRPQWVPLVTILRGAARSTDDAPISGWTVTDGRLVREVSL